LVTPPERDRFAASKQFVPYFRARFRYNAAFMVILSVASLAVWAEKGLKVPLPLDAVTIAMIAVLLVAFAELVAEPHRNLGMPFGPGRTEADGARTSGQG
jgi:hypothetical protein